MDVVSVKQGQVACIQTLAEGRQQQFILSVLKCPEITYKY